ncbi:hypothetical protein JXE04_01220 [Patescibacteria group bacterium]|nr:hypothetical protein [Patescibacteria group bacterium]
MIGGLKEYFSTHGRSLWLAAGIFFLLVVVAVGPLVYQVMADLSSEEAQAIQLRNLAISEAIINNDYETWNSLVNDKNLKSEITADNFSIFSQAYILLEQGEVEAADILKKQANLKQTYQVAVVKSALITSALERVDYNTWRATVGANYSPEVNIDNFASYAEIVIKANSGRVNNASKMLVDLGIKQSFDYTSSH